MYQRVITSLSAIAIAACGLLFPSSAPVTSVTTDWAPTRTAEGQPQAIVTLASGDTIAIGDGGWITRRTAGESDWSPARHELPESRRSTTSADRVVVSDNSLVVAFDTSEAADPAYAWYPTTGWTEPVSTVGPVWSAPDGVVGVGPMRYDPDRGWDALPEIPLRPLAMGADDAGRISAIGREHGELRIARFTPGEGWAPSIAIAPMDRRDDVDLAVSPHGDRAVTLDHDGRLELYRRLGEADWQEYVVTEGSASEHHVHLDDTGRASVVWEQAGFWGLPIALASRLDVAGGWAPVRLVAARTTPDQDDLALDGTDTGELALAHRAPSADGWTTYVRQRSADGDWSDPVEVAPVGERYGVTLSPDGCVTGYGWAAPLGRFTARTLGDCAGADPEPVDPRTAWEPLSSPSGALTYEADRIHVVRTSDGHTLLGWTSLQERSAMVAERVDGDYTEPTALGPDDTACHLRRLDAFDTVAQAMLECGPREWYEQRWTTESGWESPTPIPVAGGEVDFDVNGHGGTVAVFALYDEARPYRMSYRPSPDADWQDLPRAPAFGDRHVDWRVFLTDADEVVLVDGKGLEYAIYRESTGTWAPVEQAPLDGVDEWRVSDASALLAWSEDDLVAGTVDGGWGDRQRLRGDSECRAVALSGADRVTLVQSSCAAGPVTLLAADFDVESGAWSEPTVLGTGDGPVALPKLAFNAAGDLLVTWPHDDRFGFVEADSVWHRAADSSTWSEPAYVTEGYDVDGAILADGTPALMSDLRADAPGVWLSLGKP